uniref:Scaffold attachment factor B2 n=1 Tax=Bactrocera latifrons TaxID=174628 RepID=A0A0K8V5C2_BACLA
MKTYKTTAKIICMCAHPYYSTIICMEIAEKSSVNTSTKSSSTGKQTTPSRNLWVSGLSSLTRASDLKTIFSKYGKVIGAKVVTNTRTPGTRCYGYVTMSSSSDASRCIEHLHHTELHGRIISVERTKNEIGSSSTSVAKTRVDTTKKDEDKKIRDTTSKTRDDKRKTIDTKKDDASKKPEVEKDKQRDKEKEKDHNKKDEKEKEKEKDKEKSVASNHEKRAISKDGQKDRNIRQHPNRSRSNDRNRNDRNIRDQRQRDREREQRIRQREYIQLREERERQRLRERERELREEERRRREIRERQRQEEARLAEERRKLAQERERLEKEKAELLRLERERQKLEREKIELERLELKRQQMKYERVKHFIYSFLRIYKIHISTKTLPHIQMHMMHEHKPHYLLLPVNAVEAKVNKFRDVCLNADCWMYTKCDYDKIVQVKSL